MGNKKAFTLIELLAVIVILAIIALIAVPVIMNIINKANKSAFKDTAYGIISAGELYFAEQQLNPLGMSGNVEISLPDTTNQLELKGEVPTGSITITKEGKIALAVSNGRYCVTKDFDDTDVTITEDYETCEMQKTLVTNKIMSSLDACIKSGTCDPGTEVTVQVNSTEFYNFYVISDTGTKLTLIMDRNLGTQVGWDVDTGNNSNGPITAIAALKERTSGWTNIPEQEYTYSDDSGGNMYKTFTETMRARMITYTESTTLECTVSTDSCQKFLYYNLSSENTAEKPEGYWTSAAGEAVGNAYFISWYGNVRDGRFVSTTKKEGIRPVIELTK